MESRQPARRSKVDVGAGREKSLHVALFAFDGSIEEGCTTHGGVISRRQSRKQLATTQGASMEAIPEDAFRLEDIATLHRGVINGALFCVAVPNEGARDCLLIHAHGFRPEGQPQYAEVEDRFWHRLVQQGWTVAVTSYRRNGLIVADAIRDLFALRNWVCTELGIPYWTFLDGRSMGGAIGTRLAERSNIGRLFQGVLAIGAALLVKEDDPAVALTYKPTIPIVFLTNSDELGPVDAYVERVKKEAARVNGGGGDEIITPAVWGVDRPGHNWLNERERWRAFSCLVEWTFVGSLVTEFRFDGTTEGVARSGAVTRQVLDGSEWICTRIWHVSHGHALRTNCTLADLHAVHIRINTVMRVRLPSGRVVDVHLGAYPFVGIRDDAIACSEDPEGYLCLFAMTSFRNGLSKAVEDLGLAVGDTVHIEIPKQEPRVFRRKPMPPPIDL